MPASGRRTRPSRINCGTMRAIVLTGMAKPTPALSPVLLAMAVFMPIIRAWLSRSGPPELPGLIAASIWMIDFSDRPERRLGSDRFRLAMMPVVSVRSSPKGLPMAKTRCPTFNCVELPKTTGNSDAGGASIFSTATSVAGSWPTSRASYVLPSNKVTWIWRAPSTTWKLVRMCPGGRGPRRSPRLPTAPRSARTARPGSPWW